jgi:hypothetical protein
MSHTNRNFVLAYILLVGLPLVGLIGVLKSGRSLRAPLSVDGLWRVEADAGGFATLPCGKALLSGSQAVLAISQSGKNFTLDFANGRKANVSGVLEGTNIKASVVPSTAWAQEPGCGAGRTLSLVATVDPTTNPRSLVGMISVDNCPSCRAVEFRAVRQIPEKKGSL